jgi:hypothetical protein
MFTPGCARITQAINMKSFADLFSAANDFAACNLVRSYADDDDGNAVDLDCGIVEVSVS